MTGPDPRADRTHAPATVRAERAALAFGGAWLVSMLAYLAGFYGLIGGAPRPVLTGEVVLLILATVAPPVMIWLATRLWAAATRLEAHRAEAPAPVPVRTPDSAAPDALAAALVQAARTALADDLAAIGARLDALSGQIETARGTEPETLARIEETQGEIRDALARLEAARPDAQALDAERAHAAAERDEIRAALARMEERAAAAVEARELLKEERASTRAEREELRAALERMEGKAASVATDNRRLRAERVAAAAERDEIHAMLARLEERALGSVEEERAALIEMLLRVESQQQGAERALTALLERREADDGLARLRRAQAQRVRQEDGAQPLLPLAPAESADMPPPDWGEVLRALNFPRDQEDRDGFRALRAARRDHHLAECLQAAEDVLTLLSQDGIYMDDLVPAEVPPETWIAFANGERGAGVRGLGAIEDEAALAIARGRVRSDPVFRDSTLHFLRRFEPVLRRMADEAREAEIHALGATRTGRAFMLLARIHGAFD